MKREKGFTLIELLAVIVILAVIALIATPIVIGIIEDAKEQSNRRSIDGLVRASSLYLAQSEIDIVKKDKIENEENILHDLSVSGKLPEVGQFYLKKDGKISFALKYDKICYQKQYDGEIVSMPYTEKTCRLNININNPTVTLTVDDVFNSEGWSKENFYVHINTTDHSGLGTSIEWCGTNNDTCIPTAEIKNSEGHISFSEETSGKKICARAIDGFENSSEVICSDYYKLDKTVPSFTGIGDIIVAKDTVVDVRNGVIVTDNFDTSITYTVSPERVDTTKAGETVLTYSATDKAGNIKTITRKVIVTADKPLINYFLTNPSDVNSNGWGKSNYYVSINGVDYSGLGIEKIVWCGTTNNTCTPTSEQTAATYTILISQESNNNRICAYAVDKHGQTGNTVCSDAYKLDKTVPTLSGLTSITVNAFGTVNLTDGVSASDSLSGISGTFSYSPTSINTSIVGTTTVTYSVTDKAGNTKNGTRTVTVKQPTLKDTIINNGTVTTGNGLYKISDTEYKYRGGCTLQGINGNWTCADTDPIFNYVKLGSYLYRVIGVDSNGIKVISSTAVSNKMLDPDGTNDFNINDTNNLGYYLNKDTTASDEIKYLRTIATTAIWNVGGIPNSGDRSLNIVKNEEKSMTRVFQVGVMNASDYIEGSTNTNCQKDPVSRSANSEACRNNNWLYKTAGGSWIINPNKNTSNQGWFITREVGCLNPAWSYFGTNVNAVIYLPIGTPYYAGTGTSSNPWIIE